MAAVTSRAQAKGDRGEREIITLLAGNGITARRTRLSHDDHGDLSGITNVTAQVKNYADVTRGVSDALHDADEQKQRAGTLWAAGFVRRPGGRWIVVMTVDDWCSMHREATA